MCISKDTDESFLVYKVKYLFVSQRTKGITDRKNKRHGIKLRCIFRAGASNEAKAGVRQ